ncbi:hypothetical protein GCM10011415_37720 [Salipiger pallidus]|uniref:Type III secretion protein T n=1 Tax=Salipiger pallidus TaxID=1775170 RepID=A0A8J2ZMU8_9RHOB|nr:flagellar biosynthetic protein FliR [Salipiger pallidus]GGG84115.1 hypothetical protein GCM10011415_37720 [Salipiger pallidus]
MDDLAAERFLALPFESAFLFIALNMLRPMGLTFGFVAFSWGLGQSVTVRAGIALALALPLMILSAPGFADLRDGVQGAALPIMLVKEFALGYALGLLAGLPFLGLQFAGAVIDTYRGENAGGAPDPAGGQLPTFGLLFLIIGLFGFFASGGLWRLVGALYDSYDMWPAAQHLPRFAADTGTQLGAMVDGLLRDALVIAAPLMAILLAIDFALAVADRLSQRLRLTEHAFTSKNLAAMLSLPLMALYIERASAGQISDALDALPMLRGILP